MRLNPEDYRMSLTAILVPRPEQSHEERKAAAKRQISECLAASVLKMDKFLVPDYNNYGDEIYRMELFVFTREEMNDFMESVADATAEYLHGGSKRN
tara:strand:+ start:4589 stop:4879 length:291 start_codon:yes stop_codon:yes gene_type:complete